MTAYDTAPADSAGGDLEAFAEGSHDQGPNWMKPIEWISAGLLAAMILTIVVNVTSRSVFHHPIIWADEVASITFIWLAMLGAAVAISRNEHLKLTLFLPMIPARFRETVHAAGLLLVALFLLAMLRPAIDYAWEERWITSPALGIPMTYRAAALPTGLVLMALLAVARAVRDCKISVLLGTAAVIALIVTGLWLASPALKTLGNWNLPIFLIGLVALLLAMGVPIALCFGLGTLAYLTFASTAPIFVMIGRMDEGISSLVLLSVPVFVLLGCILDATGMGKAIVEFLASLLGHVKAGMSYVLLGSLFLVSGISGSKVSDMATVAPALFPEMKRRGHKPREMTALLATGAAMADTVPPSIVLIVLGSAAGVSIAGLFTAGFAIAMVLLVVLAVLARWKARHEDMSGVQRLSARNVGRSALVALPALILPFMIRSMVGGGFATATEVSTFAVLYALIIGVVLYGGIPARKFGAMLIETAAMSGAILLILGCASAMAWALTQSGFASQLMQMVSGLPGGWITYMAVTIVIFLVLGCVLEGLPALVLMAPIMFPVARSLGINDIHYSMVVVTAMNIGLMAPPIGIGFYIACKIGDCSPDEVMAAIWPYIAALVIGLILIAAVPYFSTALL
ncbi:TRAP transporter large permease subunit [Frigidibacter sp. MR17.14]|uniref:TRAP transporter large permease subunit n=1 Tax=Frigidibacter sp. MR17.14 TaxID=3126509 RepID=UPI003012A417